MTDGQRQDRDVHSWILSDAPDHAPDHLRTAIRSELAQTRQERGAAMQVRRGWLRSPAWSAAAAVIVLALIGIWGGLIGTGPVAPGSTPTTAPSPTAPPPPIPTLSGVALTGSSNTTDVFMPALRFTAPAGWIMVYEEPMVFHVSPPTAGYLRQNDGGLYFDGITVYNRPVAGPPDGGLTPVAGVGTSAQELATWLSTRPQLLASTPKEVTLAGLPGYRLDFNLSPEAGGLCGAPCVNLLNSADNGASFQFGIVGSWKVRAFLLDHPAGFTVMVTVDDVDGSGLDGEVRAAQPILDSLSFGN